MSFCVSHRLCRQWCAAPILLVAFFLLHLQSPADDQPLQLLLNRFDQVEFMEYNWRGVDDLSATVTLRLDLNGDLLMVGGVADDNPLIQPYDNPVMPNWWKITYGGDGVTLKITDRTDLKNSAEVALNFGAEGFNPRLMVLKKAPGALGDLGKAPVLAERQPRGYLFIARVPLPALLTNTSNRTLSSYTFRLTLHDYDGDERSYCRMSIAANAVPQM